MFEWEEYILIRLGSWKTTYHDCILGLSLVGRMEKRGEVFHSSLTPDSNMTSMIWARGNTPLVIQTVSNYIKTYDHTCLIHGNNPFPPFVSITD